MYAIVQREAGPGRKIKPRTMGSHQMGEEESGCRLGVEECVLREVVCV